MNGANDAKSLLPKQPVPDLQSGTEPAIPVLSVAAGADDHPAGMHLPTDQREDMRGAAMPPQGDQVRRHWNSFGHEWCPADERRSKMTCIYDDLANKLEVHQKMSGSPGFHLSELEIQTIIEALRYTADWKEAIEATTRDDIERPHPDGRT
jgi:hypothetical protein